MSPDTANTVAIVLLEVLDEGGAPESFIYLPVQQVTGVTLDEFQSLVEVLVEGGLLSRAPGPRLIPGPRFAAMHAAYTASKKVSQE